MNRYAGAIVLIGVLAGCGGNAGSTRSQPDSGSTELPWVSYSAPATLHMNWKVPRWKLTRGSVDVIGSAWSSPGGHSIDLDGAAPGAIESTLTTTASMRYVVNFYLTANRGCGADLKTMRISAGRESARYAVNAKSASAQANKWFPKRWSFRATGTETTIALASEDDPKSACGPTVAGLDVRPGS